jgi:cephalosporin hydroxylase
MINRIRRVGGDSSWGALHTKIKCFGLATVKREARWDARMIPRCDTESLRMHYKFEYVVNFYWMDTSWVQFMISMSPFASAALQEATTTNGSQ